MRLAVFVFLFLAAFCLVSCGSYNNSSNQYSTTTPGDVPVTMSVQDTPPAGVAVLSFEIQITSASLQPSDTTKPAVALVARPTDVELEHLQSEPALLGSLNVPAGTYSEVTVAFANPRMVILNTTVSSITVGTTVCAAKAPCKLTPALNSATTMVNTAPFPITLASNSPLGLLLHFDVNSSVQTDFSITPTIDLKEIAPSAGVIHQEHLVGTITDVSSPPFFTLQPGLGAPIPIALTLPPTFLIKTDTNTKYSFVGEDALKPSSLCTANNFSCLAVGQTVRVTANVMSDGSLLATQVSLFEQNEPAFEGTVISVNTANSQFRMALLGGQWSPAAAPTTSAAVGVIVTVNVGTAVFEIDKDGFTLPAGLTFNGIADMVAGQTVEIQPSAVSVSLVANTISLSLTTSRVRLDETQVTAQVASTNTSVTPPTFMLGNGVLPPLFSGTTSIEVQTITTPPPTQFQNVSGVSGLSKGDIVSVGGLLFNTGTTPTLLAEKVLKRVPCPAVAAGSAVTIACVM